MLMDRCQEETSQGSFLGRPCLCHLTGGFIVVIVNTSYKILYISRVESLCNFGFTEDQRSRHINLRLTT